MFVQKIPAVLHLVLVQSHAESHKLLTLFQQLVSPGWVPWLAKQSPQVHTRFASRCSHQQSQLTLLQSLPHLFSKQVHGQVVSFSQVKHVATQQSKLLTTMRELLVAAS